jgi:ABC-type lipopolysaccharide export system ATPase subunit
MAAIDWPAAVAAHSAGSLPCSGGEKRMLELAASLADHHPVILGNAVTGLDNHRIRILVKAVLHASGAAVPLTPFPARKGGSTSPCWC